MRWLNFIVMTNKIKSGYNFYVQGYAKVRQKYAWILLSKFLADSTTWGVRNPSAWCTLSSNLTMGKAKICIAYH